MYISLGCVIRFYLKLNKLIIDFNIVVYSADHHSKNKLKSFLIAQGHQGRANIFEYIIINLKISLQTENLHYCFLCISKLTK